VLFSVPVIANCCQTAVLKGTLISDSLQSWQLGQANLVAI